MNSEPQRDIEKDLLAYKQRRGEQLGAPLELHPATRKMLQGEAARTASRPLLTSEEAAKNFVRSFVMSHQQPSFFARHKQRILWGSGMCACLAVVLIVLRNDPQRVAREYTFADKLPAPAPVAAPVAEPQAAKPQAVVATRNLGVETERLARSSQPAESRRLPELEKLSAQQAGGAAPASQRGVTVTSGPRPAVQREAADRFSGALPAPVPTTTALASKEQGASAPVSAMNRAATASDGALKLKVVAETDKKLAEKAEAGESAQLAKSLKVAQDGLAVSTPEAKQVNEEVRLKLDDAFKRAPQASAAGVGGGGAPASAPVAAPRPGTAALPLTRQLSYAAGGDGGAGKAQPQQRFLQEDSRAAYRPNFNSPPMPQVMQDFAFERTGDRVRIVDADGSTYEGTVLPAPEAEALAKRMRALDESKVRKDLADQQARSAGAPVADAVVAYRFFASGVNRKLNQSVEFRGEWQPAAPAQASPATPALQTASFGAVRLEAQAAEKKEKSALTNTLADSPAATQTQLFLRQQMESSSGRISGRAVVGGKSEFDIKAVTK